MNTKRIDKLIAHLELVPKKAFDMAHWITGPLSRGVNFFGVTRPSEAKKVIKTQEQATKHECGTVACIGGYAVVLAVADKNKAVLAGLKDGDSTLRIASQWLGIDRDDGAELFAPSEVKSWDRIKPHHAVKVLKHLRDTGVVDWKKSGLRNLDA